MHNTRTLTVEASDYVVSAEHFRYSNLAIINSFPAAHVY